jgi:DNA-binding NarL/FixJ family response regulator
MRRMTDRGRADLLEALHVELLEREARLESLVEQLLEYDRPRAPAARTAPEAPAARPADLIRLTEREVQILQLLIKGHTNRQIGDLLQVGAGTIRNRLSRIYWKMGAMTRTHAAVRAVELGLCKVDPVEEP